MKKKYFFKRYGMDEDDFTKTRLDWDELLAIRKDHINNRDRFPAAVTLSVERGEKFVKENHCHFP